MRFEELLVEEKHKELLSLAAKVKLQYIETYDYQSLEDILLFTKLCVKCSACNNIFESQLTECPSCDYKNLGVQTDLPHLKKPKKVAKKA